MFEIVRDSTCSFKIFHKLFGDITGIAALCLEPDFSALGVYGIFPTLSNALRMFANAFQRFQMRCDKKRLNAIFVKPAFPK